MVRTERHPKKCLCKMFPRTGKTVGTFVMHLLCRRQLTFNVIEEITEGIGERCSPTISSVDNWLAAEWILWNKFHIFPGICARLCCRWNKYRYVIEKTYTFTALTGSFLLILFIYNILNNMWKYRRNLKVVSYITMRLFIIEITFSDLKIEHCLKASWKVTILYLFF